MTNPLAIFPLVGIPEVEPGADLTALILSAAEASDLRIADGDVLVVTQKVVSKAEGRLVRLADVEPSPLAREFAAAHDRDPRQVEVVLRECRRIVRMDRGLIIGETRHGFVCANAGVDASNASEPDLLCLLPVDPDESARRLRLEIRRRCGAEVAVIVSDSFGRPWRNGIVNVAIGLDGISPFQDYRGQTDPAGYSLKATVMAIADELAAAAELVMGKVSRVPVALIRGFDWTPADGSARDLVMAPERDMFR